MVDMDGKIGTATAGEEKGERRRDERRRAAAAARVGRGRRRSEEATERKTQAASVGAGFRVQKRTEKWTAQDMLILLSRGLIKVQ